MLTVESLTVRYGRVVAVRDVSLTVRQGEIVGLIGPNGAGKSSTLNVIAGLVRASSGRVLFRERDVGSLSPERRVRCGIAMVPEGRHIFTGLTVAENLRLGATSRRDGEVDSDVDWLLARFPALARYYRRRAGGLSGGEQQQLAIARALLSRPALLLLDEPSFGLAPLVVDQVFEIMTQLRDEGVTVLVVEQNAMRTLATADRCLVMRSGGVVLSGSRDELLSSDVTDAYLGV
jgi:branched-chain amino acid transport system ATP-binding protein